MTSDPRPPAAHHELPIATAPVAERWWLGGLVGAGLVVVVGTFLPWLRSGAVWRTSYELWRSADRLGVVEGQAAETIQLVWFLLPVGAAALLVAVALDRPRLAATVALVMALLAGLGGWLALRAPMPAGVGAVVSLAGALGLVVAATGTLVTARRAPRAVRPSG